MSSTRRLDRKELAEILGVVPHTISGAVHGEYLCRGYPVYEWAEWHPRGNQVRHYQVPVQILEEEAPTFSHQSEESK